MAVSQDDQLAAGLQAVAACCRSFLGPHPATKCVLSHPSAVAADSKSVLVDHPAALLHAMESEPTATTLLLEALEAQEAAAGSGGTWLVVLAGVILGRLRGLSSTANNQGALNVTWLMEGLSQSISICQQVADTCALPLTDLAGQLPSMSSSHPEGQHPAGWGPESQFSNQGLLQKKPEGHHLYHHGQQQQQQQHGCLGMASPKGEPYWREACKAQVPDNKVGVNTAAARLRQGGREQQVPDGEMEEGAGVAAAAAAGLEHDEQQDQVVAGAEAEEEEEEDEFAWFFGEEKPLGQGDLSTAGEEGRDGIGEGGDEEGSGHKSSRGAGVCGGGLQLEREESGGRGSVLGESEAMPRPHCGANHQPHQQQWQNGQGRVSASKQQQQQQQQQEEQQQQQWQSGQGCLFASKQQLQQQQQWPPASLIELAAQSLAHGHEDEMRLAATALTLLIAQQPCSASPFSTSPQPAGTSSSNDNSAPSIATFKVPPPIVHPSRQSSTTAPSHPQKSVQGATHPHPGATPDAPPKRVDCTPSPPQPLQVLSHASATLRPPPSSAGATELPPLMSLPHALTAHQLAPSLFPSPFQSQQSRYACTPSLPPAPSLPLTTQAEPHMRSARVPAGSRQCPHLKAQPVLACQECVSHDAQQQQQQQHGHLHHHLHNQQHQHNHHYQGQQHRQQHQQLLQQQQQLCSARCAALQTSTDVHILQIQGPGSHRSRVVKGVCMPLHNLGGVGDSSGGLVEGLQALLESSRGKLGCHNGEDCVPSQGGDVHEEGQREAGIKGELGRQRGECAAEQQKGLNEASAERQRVLPEVQECLTATPACLDVLFLEGGLGALSLPAQSPAVQQQQQQQLQQTQQQQQLQHQLQQRHPSESKGLKKGFLSRPSSRPLKPPPQVPSTPAPVPQHFHLAGTRPARLALSPSLPTLSTTPPGAEPPATTHVRESPLPHSHTCSANSAPLDPPTPAPQPLAHQHSLSPQLLTPNTGPPAQLTPTAPHQPTTTSTAPHEPTQAHQHSWPPQLRTSNTGPTFINISTATGSSRAEPTAVVSHAMQLGSLEEGHRLEQAAAAVRAALEPLQVDLVLAGGHVDPRLAALLQHPPPTGLQHILPARSVASREGEGPGGQAHAAQTSTPAAPAPTAAAPSSSKDTASSSKLNCCQGGISTPSLSNTSSSNSSSSRLDCSRGKNGTLVLSSNASSSSSSLGCSRGKTGTLVLSSIPQRLLRAAASACGVAPAPDLAAASTMRVPTTQAPPSQAAHAAQAPGSAGAAAGAPGHAPCEAAAHAAQAPGSAGAAAAVADHAPYEAPCTAQAPGRACPGVVQAGHAPYGAPCAASTCASASARSAVTGHAPSLSCVARGVRVSVLNEGHLVDHGSGGSITGGSDGAGLAHTPGHDTGRRGEGLPPTHHPPTPILLLEPPGAWPTMLSSSPPHPTPRPQPILPALQQDPPRQPESQPPFPPAIPCASILLHSRTAAGLVSAAVATSACLGRLRAVLGQGRMLPGGGVFELLCACKLREAASAVSAATTAGASSPQGVPTAAGSAAAAAAAESVLLHQQDAPAPPAATPAAPPAATPAAAPAATTSSAVPAALSDPLPKWAARLATRDAGDAADGTRSAARHRHREQKRPHWQSLNMLLAEDARSARAAALKAMASSMEDMVAILLQNQGCSFSEVLERLGEAKRLLSLRHHHHRHHCHLPGPQDQHHHHNYQHHQHQHQQQSSLECALCSVGWQAHQQPCSLTAAIALQTVLHGIDNGAQPLQHWDCRGSGACRSGVVGAQEVCDQDCGRAQDCATTMASCVCHQGIVGDDAKARQVALGTIESLVRLVLLPDMRIINYPATDP